LLVTEKGIFKQIYSNVTQTVKYCINGQRRIKVADGQKISLIPVANLCFHQKNKNLYSKALGEELRKDSFGCGAKNICSCQSRFAPNHSSNSGVATKCNDPRL